MRGLVFVFASVGMLAACSSAPTYPPITFTDRPAWRIDAPAITVEDDYASPMRTPNVEQEMPVRPADLIHAWVRDRLRAAGTGGTMKVAIRQASVIADPAPKRPQSESRELRKGSALRGEMDVDLVFTRAGGQPEITNVQVTRTTTTTKDLSGKDLDQAYYDFAKELAADLDRQLQTQVAMHMHDALMS